MSTDRQAFRATLATLADKTKAKLPTLNGRIEKAVKLALAGDVELHADGTALVNSLSDPSRAYQIAQGVCQCRDWGQAPEHLCCHRLAAGFLRKAGELAPEGPQEPAAVCSAPPLPEAPSSANVRIQLHGYEVQVTLRDHDEAQLLARLQALLALYPTPQPQAGPQGQGKDWCSKHQVAMKENHKDGRTWYSHQVGGQWCKGR